MRWAFTVHFMEQGCQAAGGLHDQTAGASTSTLITTDILVVEDTLPNLELIRTILERAGYRVHTARSGEEMRAVLASVEPDLILMDIGLPDADGLDLTQELKAEQGTTSIPVVVLTASATPTEETRAWAAGCNGFMRKPFSASSLLAEIHALLQR
ncbi:MAG: response regulator [Dehalococcoidia bacterium]|nr:response regulator [Dehalococcoidia bacterium]